MQHKGKIWEPFFHHCYGSYSPPVTSYILLEDYVLLGSKLRLRSHLYGDRLSQVEGSPTYPLATQRGCKESQFSTLQVQVFAWSPLSGCQVLATNSLGLGRLFYESSRQLQNFRHHGDQNGRKLEGWFYSLSLRHILYVVLAILQSAECFFHACTLLLHN